VNPREAVNSLFSAIDSRRSRRCVQALEAPAQGGRLLTAFYLSAVLELVA
jgi:hypothetical protein